MLGAEGDPVEKPLRFVGQQNRSQCARQHKQLSSFNAHNDRGKDTKRDADRGEKKKVIRHKPGTGVMSDRLVVGNIKAEAKKQKILMEKNRKRFIAAAQRWIRAGHFVEKK